MRKPRDINAELRVLAGKAKQLKARQIQQLGELVALTGADALNPEALAGALLETVEASKRPLQEEAWRSKGAAFFQGRSRRSKSVSRRADDDQTAPQGAGGLAEG